MIAMFDLANGRLPIIAAPTLVLLAALALRAMPLAAWAGVDYRAVIALLGAWIAVLAPATMAVACLAFAVGLDRLLDGRTSGLVARRTTRLWRPGWIEDDPERPADLSALFAPQPGLGGVWPMYRSPTSGRKPGRALRARSVRSIGHCRADRGSCAMRPIFRQPAHAADVGWPTDVAPAGSDA